jgi:hypothetical protein
VCEKCDKNRENETEIVKEEREKKNKSREEN